MRHIALYMNTAELGGVQKVMINLAKGLLDQEDVSKVDLVISRAKGRMLDQIPNNLTIIDLNQKIGNGDLLAFFSIIKLVKYINIHTPDVIIASPGFCTVAVIIANLLSGRKTKTIIMVDNKLTLLRKGKFRHHISLLIMRMVYKYSDSIVAAHESAACDLRKWKTLDVEKISRIYHPLVGSEIDYLAEENILISSDEIANSVVVLGVGRLVKEKSFDILIRSFKLVSAVFDAVLVILGDGPERQKLEKLAKKLKVEEQIYFMGNVDNPYAYMKRAKVVVVSSTVEAFGNVIVEALATGTQVVATDTQSGGPSEILGNGNYGLLSPCGDVKLLAQNIIRALNTETDVKKLFTRAKDFSIEKSSRLYREVIEKLVGQ